MKLRSRLEKLLNDIPKDKYQHFVIFGVLPFGFTYKIASLIIPEWAGLCGFISSIVLSFWKDYWLDNSEGKEPDPYDVIAGLLGGVFLWLMV